MKLALKSKINTACGHPYNFGEPVWFKLEKCHKWKSGIVVGQDGKVIFIKYAGFIRRVPLDHVIPADEYNDAEEEEPSKEDEENSRRLDDDKFENVEILVEKEKEIEQLQKSVEDQAKVIKSLENKISENQKSINQPKSINLPNRYQSVRFKQSKTGKIIHGKVVHKHKKTSMNKNILTIKIMISQKK